jgi:hypothetical protein
MSWGDDAMHWYKRYVGTNRHEKMELVALETELPRYLVIAAWDAVHETAAQHDGSVASLTPMALSVSIGCKREEAARVLDAFRSLQMITPDETCGNWGKHQPKVDLSTPRVQAFRERNRRNGGSDGNGPGTVSEPVERVTSPYETASPLGNGVAETAKRVSETQSREEEKRLDQNQNQNPPPLQFEPETHAHAREGTASPVEAPTPSASAEGEDKFFSLVSSFKERTGQAGIEPEHIEQTIAGWLEDLPKGIVRHAISRAMAPDVHDTFAYASSSIARALTERTTPRPGREPRKRQSAMEILAELRAEEKENEERRHAMH